MTPHNLRQASDLLHEIHPLSEGRAIKAKTTLRGDLSWEDERTGNQIASAPAAAGKVMTLDSVRCPGISDELWTG
jgi:hypothetical protein